jgi:hypothetical protein
MSELTLLSVPETEVTPLPVADPADELPPRAEGSGQVSLGMQVASLMTVIVPFLGLFAAAFFFLGLGL